MDLILTGNYMGQREIPIPGSISIFHDSEMPGCVRMPSVASGGIFDLGKGRKIPIGGVNPVQFYGNF